jgi:short-subunit dehydrogenase
VGVGMENPFHLQSYEHIFQMMRVNCVTQLLFSRFYLASPNPGAIIDYSSINAIGCPGGTIVYNSCKGFNSYLSQGIRAELSNVEVLTVFPASVKSFMNEGRGTFVVSAP